VRKIISILVALGLVLGLSMIATPLSADVSGWIEDGPEVEVDDPCACEESAYNITFNITASLTEGVGCVCIKFPAGTTVPATFKTGNIVINGVDVHAEEITVTGTEVCFIPPAHVAIGEVWVYFEDGATAVGIVNPCVAGDYTLQVRTCRAPDADYVTSEEYTIQPQESSYKFVVDFGPTYPGIAEDFIPPFKMCGQNDTDQPYGMEDFDTVWNATIPGWLDVFNFTFETDEVGCDVPCDNATIWAELVTCPADEVITLGFNGTWFKLTSKNLTEDVGEFDDEDWVLHDELVLAEDMTATWNASLHFSSPGKYEMRVYAECPEISGCDPEAEEIIATKILKFSVYQWKEAIKIPLYRKWNLISLPLVPLVDPPISTANKTGVLDAYALLDDVISVWYYDRGAPDCNGAWHNWPAPGDLTTMEDGKAYWIRIAYNSTTGYQMGDPADGLWVFGTTKPVPPASPSAYPVCEGWNMIGFTEMVSMLDTAYLWNFVNPAVPHDFGAVYGWTGSTQSWALMSYGLLPLWPGEGYWASFARDGTIYPP
jgi:hypothetical protein